MGLVSKWVEGIPIPAGFPEELRTKIDLSTQTIRIHGYPIKIQSDRQLTQEELSDIAEALQSYGPHMMRRLVKGDGSERPLRIFVGELESFLGAEILSLRLSRQAFWGAGEFAHHYFPQDNVLFLNTANQATFGSFKGNNSDLKATVKHELGHVVSDFAYEGIFFGRFELGAASLEDIAVPSRLKDRWLTYIAPTSDVAREFKECVEKGGNLGDTVRSRLWELGSIVQQKRRTLGAVPLPPDWHKEPTAVHIFLGWWEFFAEMARSFVTSDAEIGSDGNSTFVWKVEESIGRSLECYLDGGDAKECFDLGEVPPSWMLTGPISAPF